MLRNLLCLLILIYLPIGDINAIENQARIIKNINLQLTHIINTTELESGRVVVHSKLVNKGQKTLIFLPWNTPFDNHVNGNIFDVFSIETGFAKQQLDYQGRMVKRQEPTQADFINLASGQIIQQSLDITKFYKFCANKRYSIGFNKEFLVTGSQVNPFIKLISIRETEFDSNSNFKNCAQ